MALSGLEIYKKLPKTNCGDCGVPTCLAFAMKLASGQEELGKCPHVSEEAKAELAESSAPPIRKVTIGSGEHAISIGEETVAFRHEKKFENPTGIAIQVSDDMADADIDRIVDDLNKIEFERIGLILSADIIAIKGTDAAKFKSLVEKIISKTTKAVILIAEDINVMTAGIEAAKDKKPLVFGANKDNYEAFGKLAKENNLPLGVTGSNLDEVAEIAEKLVDAGNKELVIDTGASDIGTCLKDQVAIRRIALAKKNKGLGFPTICFANRMSDSLADQTACASIMIAKYAGIAVLGDIDIPSIYTLTVQRMNVFTDPQRPMTVDQGIYEIGTPDENSPVLVTTNFSLTYFIVSSEIESSRVPTWLAVHDSEGLSVLTAWAAGKFVPENIAPFIQKSGIKDKVKHNKIVIPGYVAQISGELEDELGDWKVTVGPREAGDLPQFLKTWSPEKQTADVK
jgi:acetyl-CoA decarbonylase/synthase complex subunit gamma